MESKLILKLNAKVIDQAKNYASEQKTSLSKLIENYLKHLTSKKKRKLEITPLVKELSGVIQVDKNFDYKSEISDYLMKKHKL